MLIDFRERRRERARERETLMWERNINGLPPVHTPTGDQTSNLGMCPDQELNPQCFQEYYRTDWTEGSVNYIVEVL